VIADFSSIKYSAVEKRKLYKKYRCHTLYEFAAKHAGMSQDTVDDIMNVHKKLEDKPILQRLIGKQGWSKVKVVATIARPETEKFWAEKVQAMAKGTLKTFVKELRKETNEVMASGQTGLFGSTTPPPTPTYNHPHRGRTVRTRADRPFLLSSPPKEIPSHGPSHQYR